ncbi:MAG: hypothetical protein AB7P04_15725 [Bacteriovoracia bacterium]
MGFTKIWHWVGMASLFLIGTASAGGTFKAKPMTDAEYGAVIREIYSQESSVPAMIEAQAGTRPRAPISAEQSAKLNLLTLYIIPPGRDLNWDSPKRLVNSVIRNYIFHPDRLIGHVLASVRCGATGEPDFFFSGMSGRGDDRALADDEGYGLGLMFHDYAGYMENPKLLVKELRYRAKWGRLSFLEFEINANTCERLQEYMRGYRANGDDKHYGLPNRPRFHEGGGCTAFSTSFIDVAGLLEPDFVAHWTRTLRVPRALVGGHWTGEKIPTKKLRKGKEADRWAIPDEPGFDLFFWDAQLMHRWVRETYDREKKQRRTDFEPVLYWVEGDSPDDMPGYRRVYGLRVNRAAWNTPDEPIFLNEIRNTKPFEGIPTDAGRRR